ncbi:MAG: DUF4179 domain-containing protein [Lachnospiraceae bacterium]|nr:DUF4179 domain-containing protein [Lachnospiraceae bacterium]
MFDDTYFKSAYQKAYDSITPDKACLDRLEEYKENKIKGRVLYQMMRPVVVAAGVFVLISAVSLPVVARSIPGVYDTIARIAPGLAEYILPTQVSCTSQGITMQVEAVHVNDKNAEVIVSFADAEGSDKDLIRGAVDLYDSYHLKSYSSYSNVGGCTFLEYDAEADKAYFKVDVWTDGSFRQSKLSFRTRQLLLNKSDEKKWLDLSDIVINPAMKKVEMNGGGGMPGTPLYEQYFGEFFSSTERLTQVLDLQQIDESMMKELTITGIGYADGILHVQCCRGDFAEADRHLELYIVDADGTERHNDLSIGWQEEVNGERVLMDELLFQVDESELADIQMYGIFHIIDGSMKGDWEVTFSIEN